MNSDQLSLPRSRFRRRASKNDILTLLHAATPEIRRFDRAIPADLCRILTETSPLRARRGRRLHRWWRRRR
jgi:hypothetical protein